MAAALAATLPGCATSPRPPAPAAARPDPLPAAPAPAPEPAPRPAPSPLYRNPTIGMVYLRAHEDAEGRLLGPQVIYQIVEPGGWNLAALDAPARPAPAAAAGPSPAALAPPLPASPPPASPLLDPSRAAQTTITGLMRAEDRPQAEAQAAAAGGGRTAVFDPEAGWLIVPPAPSPSP